MVTPKRPKSKTKNNKNYFPKTGEVDCAIIEYNRTTDPIEKSKIYEEKIHYAFFKLTENIINTFKFHNLDAESISDFQQEVIIFLLSKIHLFHHSKNVDDRLFKIIVKEFQETYIPGSFAIFTGDSDQVTQEQINEFVSTLKVSKKCREKIVKTVTPAKAYSYFGTITKRYCIIATTKNYKKKITKTLIDELDQSTKHASDIETVDTSIEKLSNFMDKYILYCMENIFNMFPDSDDAKIADAILMLFKNRDKLIIFNKKALYIDIREHIDVKTPRITKVAEKLYKVFKNNYITYKEKGYIYFPPIFINKQH
jgi:hypothetical protein